MLFKPKSLTLLLLSILFNFALKNSSAQSIGVGFGVGIPYMAMGGMRYNIATEAANQKHSFTVVMADGTSWDFDSKIYTNPTLRKSYVFFVNDKLPKTDTNRNVVIYPGQTKKLIRKDAVVFVGSKGNDGPKEEPLAAVPKDTCWMFKIYAGAISIYSYKAETDASQYFDFSTMVGIQSGDDPIMRYSEENLRKLISSDAEAMELFYKKDYYKAIKKFDKNAERASKK
jgi:hypothetical protein